MDPQIDDLLCEHCRPVVAAKLDLERAELNVKLARDKLQLLRTNSPSVKVGPHAAKIKAKYQPKAANPPPPTEAVADPFKGKRNSTWKDVPVAEVLRNIRGDIAPHDLCKKLNIATSVLRRRVQDIIGMPDSGRRWQKGIGYVVKGKPAWDHERDLLRVDKSKGVAMAAFEASKGKGQSKAQPRAEPKTVGGRTPKPGPSDAELHAYLDGKINVAKLTRRYKCGKGKIYRAIEAYKVRFGADAPHGEPRAISNGLSSQANGIMGTAAHSAAH